MSDLIIKKNGTDYKLPMLAEHYPADRVYLDGDINKTVQDAIDGNFTLAGTITTLNGEVSIPSTANEILVNGSVRAGYYNGDTGIYKRAKGDVNIYSMSLSSSAENILYESLLTLDSTTNKISLAAINKIISSSNTLDISYKVYYR